MSASERAEGVVRRFLAERGRDAEPVSDTTPLLTSGLLDSIDILTLVLRLEDECGLKISPLEVSLDQLDSIAKIRSFVAGKRSRES